MYHQPEHVGHWEGLEMWLSATTNSILPKAAEALQHQTQDQLDDNITSIMRQDPSQNYNHKELAKITSSLSHTLIATLKLSDKYAAQRQQELTSAQRRTEQLEREAQIWREGTDEVEQGADEEINRLKETLEATRHETQQLKEDLADCADKLPYAEKLLEKAKTDFRDKNSRIKALEAHLAESRNEISRLTQQLDYVTEESESFQEELKHAYELRHEPSRTGRAPTAPLPSRTKSPVPGLTREHKTEGVMLKQSPAPSEELYITTEPEESAAASRRSSHSLDLKDLDKLARNVGKFNPSVPNSQTVQAYLQDIDFHLEMRPNVTDKDKLYLLRTTSSPEVRSFLDRQPVNTKTDYQRLRKALIKEFADPESDQGLVAALETRQGRQRSPGRHWEKWSHENQWEKEDEPESAWLAVRRNGSDKLNKSAPENSTASPCSQRTVNTLTSDGHETPPENPATELNTNSTPNTPNHSSVQQTPADETPSSWKCCLSHLPFLRRTPDQVWHPKRFLPNSSPSNDQNDALTIAGASHEESWTFHALPPNPTVAAVTRRQHATGEHTPALLHYHTTSVRCWRSPHPHMRIRHYEPWQLTCQNHDNTSSELRKLHSVDYMLHLQDGVHTYVPEPLTAPQLVVPHGQRGSTWTHAHDALWWVASANRQIQTTDRKRGRIRPTDTDRQPYAPHKHNYCHFRKTYSNHA